MDSEQRQMLEKLLEMTGQNNKILRALHRQMILGKIFTVLYWVIIIGLAVWSFNLIQPYFGMMGDLTGKTKQIQDFNIQDLLK